MSMKDMAFKRFDALVQDQGFYTRKLPFGVGHNYTVFSDLHMGEGNDSDKFIQNEEAAVKALEYYANKGFSIILLGDIEDFHQVDSNRIVSHYGDTVYKALKAFPPEKIYRVFGNHDIEWSLKDPIFNVDRLPFSSEAIKLGEHILMTHGHQAEEWYERDLNIVRVGTTLDRVVSTFIPKEGNYSCNMMLEEKDQIYFDWAIDRKKILICGHTHHPVSASKWIYDWVQVKTQILESEIKKADIEHNADKLKKLTAKLQFYRGRQSFLDHKMEVMNITPRRLVNLDEDVPNYFNPGSGLYLDGMTNLEIEGNIIRLVYWGNQDMERENIWGDSDVSKLFE